MIKKILVSLSITVAVSLLFAIIFSSHAISVFLLILTLQFVSFYIGNTIYNNRLVEKAELIRLDQLKEASKQIVTIECPCGDKTLQDVVIRFDQDNIYKCNKCNKNIKANIDIKPAVTTEPIYFNE